MPNQKKESRCGKEIFKCVYRSESIFVMVAISDLNVENEWNKRRKKTDEVMQLYKFIRPTNVFSLPTVLEQLIVIWNGLST